ncbi:hypothetical protein PAMC26577_00425 [Caballeronia sordidicola]|uniref:Uncharacterized protein n=1 Tax=Caballeronia sordidicola TaxID=196367 RepID=A0A242N7R3_CABSO|nr:hypothetical protein PAMC26577_32500 [Caballeronia sordidicola]OTP70762.1 hypothetical protein PAMC26577_25885 [Caballeronia sordidicola]OTP79668.1 hypothetical protein PAMC26577_00425 [Caballeronia sordidicola]
MDRPRDDVIRKAPARMLSDFPVEREVGTAQWSEPMRDQTER